MAAPDIDGADMLLLSFDLPLIWHADVIATMPASLPLMRVSRCLRLCCYC